MVTHELAPEFAILDRVLSTVPSGMSREAAQAILALQFGASDLRRMNVLAAQARDDALTADEAVELSAYERIGHLLSLLHVRALTALQQSDLAA